MLTYEPVSIISAEPSVTNSLDTSKAELAWRGSPADLIAGNIDSRVVSHQNGQTLFRLLATIRERTFHWPRSKFSRSRIIF